jgi:hypothetical protein
MATETDIDFETKQAPVQETLVLTAKKNRHVVIALNHMNKRRDALLEKRAALTKEIDELDAAILALE